MGKYRKELSGNGLYSFILNSVSEIEKEYSLDEAIVKFEKFVKEAIQADFTKLFFINLSPNFKYIRYLDKSQILEYDITNGIFSKVIDRKKPILKRGVTNSKIYYQSIDNPEELPFKDLIYIPMLHPKNHRLIAILQIGIFLDKKYSFKLSDVERGEELSYYFAKYLSNKEFENNVNKNLFNELLSKEIKKQTEIFFKQLKDTEAIANFRAKLLVEVAHEIKTPMNAILGFMELLKLNERNEEKLKYLNIALADSQYMVSLVNNILDMTSLQSGKMVIENISFNPQLEFSSIAYLFYSKVAEKNIKLNSFIDPLLPTELISDPLKIKQVITNLLSNAVKFTPKGGMIKFNVIWNEKKRAIYISVEDNGIGIEKYMQKAIFEKYVRIDNSITKESGGAGLGLYISKRIVELLGGELEVDSKKGMGSIFYFSVPIKFKIDTSYSKYGLPNATDLKIAIILDSGCSYLKDYLIKYFLAFGIKFNQIDTIKKIELVKEANYTHIFIDSTFIQKEFSISYFLKNTNAKIIILKNRVVKDIPNSLLDERVKILNAVYTTNELFNIFREDRRKDYEIKRKFKNKNVLIIDNNQVTIEYLKEVLKALGISSQWVDNGEDGIEAYKRKKLSSTPYDMVLLHDRLPDIDFTDVIKIILSVEEKHNLPHTPIIAYTDNHLKDKMEIALEVGADEFFVKPMKINRLKNLFEKYFKK